MSGHGRRATEVDGRCRSLTNLIQNRRGRFDSKLLVIAGKFLSPESRGWVDKTSNHALAEIVVEIQSWQINERRPRTRQQRGYSRKNGAAQIPNTATAVSERSFFLAALRADQNRIVRCAADSDRASNTSTPCSSS